MMADLDAKCQFKSPTVLLAPFTSVSPAAARTRVLMLKELLWDFRDGAGRRQIDVAEAIGRLQSFVSEYEASCESGSG